MILSHDDDGPNEYTPSVLSELRREKNLIHYQGINQFYTFMVRI